MSSVTESTANHTALTPALVLLETGEKGERRMEEGDVGLVLDR